MDKEYEKLQNELILRDHLAINRTVLANERTLLAYIRTCLGFFATGTALINFIHSFVLEFLGYIFIVAPGIIFIFGLYRFLKIKYKIKRIYAKGRTHKSD
ncbi:MAG: DUF202 domain-containing protein [Oscillospiraceae bacterium]|nr:DUF202 domain-containing protein [Oscillospiraceae bacterium]